MPLAADAVATPIRCENAVLSVVDGAPPGEKGPSVLVTESAARGHHRIYLDVFEGTAKFVGAPTLDLDTQRFVPPKGAFKRGALRPLGDGWYEFWVVAEIAGGPNARFSIGALHPDTGTRVEFPGDPKIRFLVSAGEIVRQPRIGDPWDFARIVRRTPTIGRFHCEI